MRFPDQFKPLIRSYTEEVNGNVIRNTFEKGTNRTYLKYSKPTVVYTFSIMLDNSSLSDFKAFLEDIEYGNLPFEWEHCGEIIMVKMQPSVKIQTNSNKYTAYVTMIKEVI